jgi:hypothetical protein
MGRGRVHRGRGLFGAALVAGVALAAAPLAGCFSDATEVVVVVDTDLQPSEFGSLTFSVVSGNFNAGAGGGSFDPTMTALPATMGVVPVGSSTDFDVTVTMWPPGVGPGGPAFPQENVPVRPGTMAPTLPMTSRKASHVRFVGGAQQMLFLPLTRPCLCNGTSCPHALDPECRELISPAMTAFDSSRIPRIRPDETADASP